METDALLDALEGRGYTNLDVTENRNTVRVTIPDVDGSGGELREVVTDTVDESDILGIDITNESVDAYEGVSTVISIRQKP